jgi:hypothetical protein
VGWVPCFEHPKSAAIVGPCEFSSVFLNFIWLLWHRFSQHRITSACCGKRFFASRSHPWAATLLTFDAQFWIAVIGLGVVSFETGFCERATWEQLHGHTRLNFMLDIGLGPVLTDFCGTG